MIRQILFVTLAVLGLPACDPCGPFERQYVDVIGLSTVAVRQVGASSPAQVLAAGQSVPVAELQLRLQLNTRLYSSAAPRTGGFAALACEPSDPMYTESIDSLTVTSRFDFDARHPAGAPLNDLLRVGNQYGQLVPLTQALATPQLASTLALRVLQLAQGPANSTSTQQFRVRYRLTNGEVYTAETVAVTIQP